jgi:hypothetical protein
VKHLVYGLFLLLGQTHAVSSKCIGTWRLNTQKSTFGAILAPGAPAVLTVLSQTLRIEVTRQTIRLSGETVVSDAEGSHSGQDDNSLNLNGQPTIAGPVSLSFRRVDDLTFEIVSTLRIGEQSFGEVTRFSFSSDGKTLTEKKTQTESEAAPSGADPARSAVIRSSISVLVFDKVPK